MISSCLLCHNLIPLYKIFQLILNERSGFLGRHKMTVLHQGEGPIRNIKWGGEFIAWANNNVSNVFYVVSFFQSLPVLVAVAYC